jgi:serine/threonine protein kinase
LPATSRAVRRKRGEKITAEPGPAPKNGRPLGNTKLDSGSSSAVGMKQLWLESEPKWKIRLGDSWKGRKVLGARSFGIAGLWSLDETDANKDQAVRNVVVKQSGARKAVIALREEADILQLFKNLRTKHIVRIYGKYMVELSGGQVDLIGGGGNNIARIYIEYCQGGDMRNFLKILKGYWCPHILRFTGRKLTFLSKFTAQNPMPEELIWEIFKCLTLGLAVMQHGNEQLNGPAWDKEVAHMDIKPENSSSGLPILVKWHSNVLDSTRCQQ